MSTVTNIMKQRTWAQGLAALKQEAGRAVQKVSMSNEAEGGVALPPICYVASLATARLLV